MSAVFPIVWGPIYSRQFDERPYAEFRILQHCFLKGWPVDRIGWAIVKYVLLIVFVLTDDDVYVGRVGTARAGGTDNDEAISLWSTSSPTADTSQRRTSTIVTKHTSVAGGAGGPGGPGGGITRTDFSGIGAFSSYDLIRISNHHPTGR
jgi:hypothetical protein